MAPISLPHIETGFPREELDEMFLTLKPSLPPLFLYFYLRPEVGGRHLFLMI